MEYRALLRLGSSAVDHRDGSGGPVEVACERSGFVEGDPRPPDLYAETAAITSTASTAPATTDVD